MNKTVGRSIRPARSLGRLLVGLYAWAAAVYLGITLIDVLYARLVPGATLAFSVVADLLLLASAGLIVVALVSIAFSWNSSGTRFLLLASLVVALLGLLAPVLISPFLPAGSAWGAGIRLAVGAAVSATAFIAFHKLRLDQ